MANQTCTYGVSPLLPLTGVPLVGPNPPQGQESIEVLLLLGDSTRGLGLVNAGESQLSSGGVGLELLSLNRHAIFENAHRHQLTLSSESVPGKVSTTYRSVTLLGLASLLGEDDQPAPVLLEPLDVDLLAFLGPSVPPVVNDDTQALGLLPRDTGLLQLGESETSTEPNLGVVSLGGGTDGRSEQLEGSDSEGQGLLLTSDTPGVLSAGLVEPGLDTLLLTRQGRH
jgi:hypothetical protein